MKRKRLCGLYFITSITDNKKYIGSSNNIKNRWRNHIFLLKNNKHHSTHLQNAWNLYGEENFKFEIFLEVEEDRLQILEQFFLYEMKLFDPNHGYNISQNTFSPFLGKNHSEETKRHLRDCSSGENHWAWGKKQTEKHNRNISLTNKKYSDLDEFKMFEMFQSGHSYTEIKTIFNEKHLETIRRIIARVQRFKDFYEK